MLAPVPDISNALRVKALSGLIAGATARLGVAVAAEASLLERVEILLRRAAQNGGLSLADYRALWLLRAMLAKQAAAQAAAEPST